jgi:hypothetical protein
MPCNVISFLILSNWTNIITNFISIEICGIQSNER